MKIRRVLQALALMAMAGQAWAQSFGWDDPSQPPSRVQRDAWVAYQPTCADGVSPYPSKQNCDDGDATLFNGLLCAVSIEAGCDAVRRAQSPEGRWHRSPRYAAAPNKRPANSLSPDMALGVQLYLLKKNDVARAKLWVEWLEKSVACAVEGPKGCVYRSPFPRFCTDDDEKGCTIRPGDASTLALTLKKLGVMPPASTTLGAYLRAFESIYPGQVALDALVNRPGYSRHLVAITIMVARLADSPSRPELAMAALMLSAHEPMNPMFAALAGKPSTEIGPLISDLCPQPNTADKIAKHQWSWERTDSEAAWRESMLWDCQFAYALMRGN